MLPFAPPSAADAARIAPFFSMRPNRTCESGVLDTFIWRGYYDTQVCVADGKALLFLMRNEREIFSAMPCCAEDDLAYYFRVTQEYFNTALHRPLKIYLADEESILALGLANDPDYIVREEEDLKDYLYDAEALRTLSGRTYHKKKNLINRFCHDYAGRWEYRSLDVSDRALILDFLDRWFLRHDAASEETAEADDPSLDAERNGLDELFRSGIPMFFKAGGIFIDGVLSALSLGSLNPRENMAVISIEKADPSFTGLYQLINREFLCCEFPDAVIVNREDDVGIPGLRKAKESYHPIGFERKYMVLQKSFPGYEECLGDYYEEEIRRSLRE